MIKIEWRIVRECSGCAHWKSKRCLEYVEGFPHTNAEYWCQKWTQYLPPPPPSRGPGVFYGRPSDGQMEYFKRGGR